jgi:membrane associated rhomboid family serine protease
MFASSLSRKILIASVILMILSFFGLAQMITTATVLVPSMVFPGMQVWRIATYPLAFELFGLILAVITFSIPGEELEAMLGIKQFALLLVLMTLFVGLMHTALFFKGAIPLGGPANMAFFVMVGYVYLYPDSEVQVLFIKIRSWVLLALFGGILLAIVISSTSTLRDLLSFFPSGGFGLILGAAYFHARFQKYPFLLKPIRSVERIAGFSRFSPAARKPSPLQRRTATQQPVRVRIPFQKQVQRELTDEERLNMILEKINEKSYNSLTEDEKRFLQDYSGRL